MAFHFWNTGCATGKGTADSVFYKMGPLIAQASSWFYRFSHLKSGNLFSYHPKTPEISFWSFPFTKGFVFPTIRDQRSEISHFFGPLARQDGGGGQTQKKERGGKRRERKRRGESRWEKEKHTDDREHVIYIGAVISWNTRPSVSKKYFHVKTLDTPKPLLFSHEKLTSLSVIPKMVKAEPRLTPKCNYPNQNMTGNVFLYRNKSSSILLQTMSLPTGSGVLPSHCHQESILSTARSAPRVRGEKRRPKAETYTHSETNGISPVALANLSKGEHTLALKSQRSGELQIA